MAQKPKGDAVTRKQRRLYFVLLGMLALAAATALVLTAVGDGMVYIAEDRNSDGS